MHLVIVIATMMKVTLRPFSTIRIFDAHQPQFSQTIAASRQSMKATQTMSPFPAQNKR
jgi:hypothetical protein